MEKNKKAAFEKDSLISLLFFLLILVIAIVAIAIFTGKFGSAIGYIQNLFRFGSG